jgi:hypothetical protein
MKNIFFLISIIISFNNCSKPLYVQNTYFDCPPQTKIEPYDRSELIHLALRRALVVEKDIPDYDLFQHKARIYIMNPDNKNQIVHLDSSDVPTQIDSIRFCLKSKKELQQIANITGENFLCIAFESIEIVEKTATIAIRSQWIGSSKKTTVFLSSGGYHATYKKVNGQWKLDAILGVWMS